MSHYKKYRIQIVLAVLTLVFLSGGVFAAEKILSVQAADFLSSDLNQDGIVDTKDVDIIKQHYSNTAGGLISPSPYDLNNDHQINAFDLAVVEDNQGNGTNPHRDYDQDGWTVAQGDCNDRNSTIHRFAEEASNGVDDNCNGETDDYVNFQPIASKTVNDISLNWSEDASKKITFQLSHIGIREKSYNFVSTFGAGPYFIQVNTPTQSDAARYFFDVPSDIIAEGIKTTTAHENSGTVRITVPYIATGQTLVLKSLLDTTPNQLLDASNIKTSTPITQSSNNDECPSLMRGETNGTYGVEFCAGFDNFPKQAEYIEQGWAHIKNFLPYLNYYPLRSITIESPDDMKLACHADGAVGCYTKSHIFLSSELLSVSSTELTLAHELSHYLEDVLRGSDYYAYKDGRQTYFVASLVKKINKWGCRPGDYSCTLNTGTFFANWDTHQPTVSPFASCEGIRCEWIGEYLQDPITHKPDPESPRPSIPGLQQPYGIMNQMERWAMVFESIFLDAIGQDSAQGDVIEVSYSLRHLVGKDSQYPPYTEEMTKDVALLSKAGFVKDWDYDGVPDDEDNCAPERYPTKCPIPKDPTAQNSCHNPDQADVVNASGSQSSDGIGDKCQFTEGSWTACMPRGGFCGSPDGSTFSSNSPNTPRWPLNGDPNSFLDYCSLAPAVYIMPGDTAKDVCPSPDQNQ